MKNKIIFSILIYSFLSGCVTMSNLDKSDTTISKSSGIIVLGVKPDYRVAIKLGDMDDGNYLYSPNLPASANIIPDDSGYIVVKLEETKIHQRYGITQLLPSGFTGPRIGPCDGASTVTFNVIGGQITYLGDIDYGPVSSQPKAQYTSNMEKATDYIKNNYPALGVKLNKGAIIFAKVVNMPCNEGPVNVPIYMP